jgi:hypothetical protein
VWHGDIIRLLCSWQKITEAVAQNRIAVWNAGKFTKNQSLFLIFFSRMKVARAGIVLELQCWIKKGKGGCNNRRPIKNGMYKFDENVKAINARFLFAGSVM